jgi:hypothetical protein
MTQRAMTKLRSMLCLTGLMVVALTATSAAKADGMGLPDQSYARPDRFRPAVEDCGGFPTAYTVVLDGFNDREMAHIEEYLAAFKCFDHMRPLRMSMGYAAYWYEGQSDALRLFRNLRIMLTQMNITGQVQFGGNVVRVIKVAARPPAKP